MCHSATRHSAPQTVYVDVRSQCGFALARQGRKLFATSIVCFVHTRYASWRTMSSRLLSTQDVVFRRALLALPQPLRDALAEAELDDPGPRDWRTRAALGLTQKAHEEGRRRQRYGRCWCSAGHRGGYGYEYCARMAGSTDTLVGGTMELSSISGAVPVVFLSSFSFFPSLSSPLPVVFGWCNARRGTRDLGVGHKRCWTRLIGEYRNHGISKRRQCRN